MKRHECLYEKSTGVLNRMKTIREEIENQTGKLSNEQFKNLMYDVTAYIKKERIASGIKTMLEDVVLISQIRYLMGKLR